MAGTSIATGRGHACNGIGEWDGMTSFSQTQIARVVGRARALGDPTRLRILVLIARSERAVGEVARALSMQQSTVSKHLQVLFNAGLVDRRRAASAVIYSTTPAAIGRLLLAMDQVRMRRRRMNSSRDSHANVS